NHDFPCWIQSKAIADKYKKLDFLEEQMAMDINSRFFIPNIQCHEYESLLFSDYDNLITLLPLEDIQDQHLLLKTFREYQNPELINDSPITAPSKRLEQIIKGYSKVLHGHYIAENL